MGQYKYILFDAANTLIHKPKLWDNINKVLLDHGHQIPLEVLKRRHKLISECLRFPDRTSSAFYQHFNSELLYSMGIIPTEKMVDDIFTACTYLPWEKFSDTGVLESLDLPCGILSNFNHSLNGIIEEHFGSLFSNIIVSESIGFGKPEERFYNAAIKEIGLRPSEILYIGDSLKLDIDPATKVGIPSVLIDRDEVYPYFSKRLKSLNQIPEFL